MIIDNYCVLSYCKASLVFRFFIMYHAYAETYFKLTVTAQKHVKCLFYALLYDSLIYDSASVPRDLSFSLPYHPTRFEHAT